MKLPRERHPHGIRYPALCTCPSVRALYTTATERLGSPRVVQLQLLAGSWSSRAKSAIQSFTWAISSEGETPTCVAAVREQGRAGMPRPRKTTRGQQMRLG